MGSSCGERRLPAGGDGRLELPEPHGHSLVGLNTTRLTLTFGE
jgi:hypothetical protein